MPFGFTRSRIEPNHALITPESHVPSTLPGWTDTDGFVLISPQMGARFTQFLAQMSAGASAAKPLPQVERFFYVQMGRVALEIDNKRHELLPGGYAFVPANAEHQLSAVEASTLVLFERRHLPLDGAYPTTPVIGREQDVPGEPFLGDEDALLQTLLPLDPSFDMAVNLFSFQPGAALPLVEVHLMEHGLIFLDGGGIYRLGDAWYPVQQGDVIWMASYCPQWFGCVGKTPARYLYYKDMHRDALAEHGA